MAVSMNVEDSTLTIEDMGVTVRTLLAHAAEGYKVNQRRKWDIIYKGVAIASVRVRTKNKEPLIPVKPVKVTQKQAVFQNMGEVLGLRPVADKQQVVADPVTQPE